MDWYWISFEIIINIMEMGFAVYLARSLFLRGRLKNDTLITCAAVALGAAWLSLYSFTDFPFLSSIFPLVVVFFLYALFFLRAAWFPALCWALVYDIVVGICAYTSFSVLNAIFKGTYDHFMTSGNARFLWIALSHILLLSIVVALARIFGKRSGIHLSGRGLWGLIALPVFSVFLLMVLLDYAKLDQAGRISPLLPAVAGIGLLALNVGFLLMLEYLSRQAEQTLRLQTRMKTSAMQARHNEELQGIYKNMRSAGHDFNNRIYTIQGLLNMKDYAQLEAYVATFSSFFSSVTEFVDTGNKVVDALLSAKIANAKAQQMVVELNARIPEASHESNDRLCVILGNLFDNAYDACMRMERGQERRIRLHIQLENNYLCIQCENSTTGEERRDRDTWRSLKDDAHSHGFGLANIDQAVAECGGYCTRQHLQRIFTTTIILPAHGLFPAP